MNIITIDCIQCNQPFDFDADEQAYFQQRGYDTPKRCPACRRNKTKEDPQQQWQRHREKKKHYHQKYGR